MKQRLPGKEHVRKSFLLDVGGKRISLCVGGRWNHSGGRWECALQEPENMLKSLLAGVVGHREAENPLRLGHSAS